MEQWKTCSNFSVNNMMNECIWILKFKELVYSISQIFFWHAFIDHIIYWEVLVATNVSSRGKLTATTHKNLTPLRIFSIADIQSLAMITNGTKINDFRPKSGSQRSIQSVATTIISLYKRKRIASDYHPVFLSPTLLVHQWGEL